MEKHLVSLYSGWNHIKSKNFSFMMIKDQTLRIIASICSGRIILISVVFSLISQSQILKNEIAFAKWVWMKKFIKCWVNIENIFLRYYWKSYTFNPDLPIEFRLISRIQIFDSINIALLSTLLLKVLIYLSGAPPVYNYIHFKSGRFIIWIVSERYIGIYLSISYIFPLYYSGVVPDI